MVGEEQAQYRLVLKLVEEAQRQAQDCPFRVRVLLQMLVIELHLLLEQLSNTGTGIS